MSNTDNNNANTNNNGRKLWPDATYRGAAEHLRSFIKPGQVLVSAGPDCLVNSDTGETASYVCVGSHYVNYMLDAGWTKDNLGKHGTARWTRPAVVDTTSADYAEGYALAQKEITEDRVTPEAAALYMENVSPSGRDFDAGFDQAFSDLAAKITTTN